GCRVSQHQARTGSDIRPDDGYLGGAVAPILETALRRRQGGGAAVHRTAGGTLMRQVIAREVMTTPGITVSPDTPFGNIVAIMLKHRISGVPVVDEGGRLVGIVTEADLLLKEEEPRAQPALIPWHGSSLRLERIRDRHRKAEGRTAGALMTENVVSATEDATAHHLAHLMLARDVNRVPIVRDGRVVGIVTRADVLKVFTRG